MYKLQLAVTDSNWLIQFSCKILWHHIHKKKCPRTPSVSSSELQTQQVTSTDRAKIYDV